MCARDVLLLSLLAVSSAAMADDSAVYESFSGVQKLKVAWLTVRIWGGFSAHSFSRAATCCSRVRFVMNASSA